MSGRPLLVLGLKVGDPDSIERWAAEGYLPTIASLMERGCHGRLAHPTRVCEHGSATTLWTGVPPDRHGCFYFRQLVPGTYRLAPFHPKFADVMPFWTRPEVYSGSVALIDLLEVTPAPGVRGVQLGNWTPSYLAPAGSEPPALIGDVHRAYGKPFDLLADVANGTPAEDRAALDDYLASVEYRGEVCRHILSPGDAQFSAAFFEETHAASHRYWHYRPEAAGGGHEDDVLRNAVRTVYQATDRECGRILESIDPHTNVVFVSLFGMEERFPTEGLNDVLCTALGYQVGRSTQGNGGGFRPVDIARRILPERIRIAISRRLPVRRQEALLADRLARGTDWERTTAFSIPSLYTAFIRVNLRGREPHGIVDPADYDGVLDRIESDLRELVDAKTGRPAIESVARTVEVFGGDPPSRLPDLFAEWTAGLDMVPIIRHPKGELTQAVPSMRPGSEETLVGFIAAAGPDVEGRGNIGDLSPTDFAPTLLKLLGGTPPPDMPGRPHAGLLG